MITRTSTSTGVNNNAETRRTRDDKDGDQESRNVRRRTETAGIDSLREDEGSTTTGPTLLTDSSASTSGAMVTSELVVQHKHAAQLVQENMEKNLKRDVKSEKRQMLSKVKSHVMKKTFKLKKFCTELDNPHNCKWAKRLMKEFDMDNEEESTKILWWGDFGKALNSGLSTKRSNITSQLKLAFQSKKIKCNAIFFFFFKFHIKNVLMTF